MTWFLALIGFFLSLYACAWVARGIFHKHYRWIAWPVLIALLFAGGIIGQTAAVIILMIFLAWILGAPSRRQTEHNHKVARLTEWNGQNVWWPNPDKPGSNMYVAGGREEWERILAKRKTEQSNA